MSSTRMKIKNTIACLAALLCIIPAGAQRYKAIDKSIAVVGNELITVSDLENEIQMMRAQGQSSDRATRCQLLENMMQSKLFLMQARLDSLTVNMDMVDASLNEQMARVRTALGGDEQTEAYFGKSLYQLRKDWKQQFEDNSLIQQNKNTGHRILHDHWRAEIQIDNVVYRHRSKSKEDCEEWLWRRLVNSAFLKAIIEHSCVSLMRDMVR